MDKLPLLILIFAIALSIGLSGCSLDSPTGEAKGGAGKPGGAVCGNGVCEQGENAKKCPADCGDIIEPVCGNGVLEGKEECDDGNTLDGDGCSATCMFEEPQCVPLDQPSESIPENRVVSVQIEKDGEKMLVKKILPGTGPYFTRTFQDQVYVVDLATANAANGRFTLEELDALSAGEGSFIVELNTEPVLVKAKKLGLDISSQKLTPEIISHRKRIKDEQDSVFSKIKNKFDSIEKTSSFDKTFNGFVINVSAQDLGAQITEIASMDGVKNIYLNKEVQANLSDSIPQINVDQVWELTDGSGNQLLGDGITIAIIDTGIDYTHPDLGGCLGAGCKVIGGYDFINNDSDPMDDHGHGTHVGATAAGNGVLKGVAPNANLLAYKVLSAFGGGSWETVIAGIERSVDPNNDGDYSDHADVINLSLGGYGDPDDPVSTAIDNAVDNGIIAAISAGNNYGYFSISSPGTARKAITVGAVDKQGVIAGFSSRGPVTGADAILVKPDVMAPGVDICAAQWEDAWSSSQCIDNEHTAISGTSMASPHVAGVIALLKQAHPTWGYEEIKGALVGTATDLGLDSVSQGGGLVNALKAVNAEVIVNPSSLGFFAVGEDSITENLKLLKFVDDRRGIRVIKSSKIVKIESGFPEYDYSLNFKDEEICLRRGSTNARVTLSNISALDTGYYSGKITLEVYDSCNFTTKIDEVNLPFAISKLKKINVNIIPKPLKADETIWFKDIGFIGTNFFSKDRYSLTADQLSGSFFVDQDRYDILYTKFNVTETNVKSSQITGFNPIQLIIGVDLTNSSEIDVEINENSANPVQTNGGDIISGAGLIRYGIDGTLKGSDTDWWGYSSGFSITDSAECPQASANEFYGIETPIHQWEIGRREFAKDTGLSYRDTENILILNGHSFDLTNPVINYETNLNSVATEFNHIITPQIQYEVFGATSINSTLSQSVWLLSSPINTAVQKTIHYSDIPENELWISANPWGFTPVYRSYDQDWWGSTFNHGGETIEFFKEPIILEITPNSSSVQGSFFDSSTNPPSRWDSTNIWVQDEIGGTLAVTSPSNNVSVFNNLGSWTLYCDTGFGNLDIGSCEEGNYEFEWVHDKFTTPVSLTETLNWNQSSGWSKVFGICGNGELETGETCDDGNRQSGDGCSASCNLEAGLTPITDCHSLQNMNLTDDYYLVQDVDCSETINWNGGLGFMPMGDSANNFTGTLNGGNNIVSNLYINRPTSSYVGLFGYVGTSNFEVQNLGLENVNITGNGFVGGIVGRIESGGTIRNSYTTGTVSGRSYLGGLVGRMRYNNAGIVTSYSNATVTNVGGSSFYTGGLVGDAYRDSYIKHSYSTGNVTGGSHSTGGIAGRVYDAIVVSSYSTGNVSSDGLYEGGLVGDFDNGATMIDSYATGTTTNTGTNAGGLVGRLRTISSTNPTTITNSYFTGYDNGYGGTRESSPSVFYGSSHFVYFGSSNWDFINTWTFCPNNYPVLSWDPKGCPVDSRNFVDGKIYPYDPAHTGTKPYSVTIAVATSDPNALYSYKISNSAEVWDDPDGGSFDLGPLYPTRAGQSLTGVDGVPASFLQSSPNGTLGKNFVNVEFLGFEGNEDRSIIEFGKDVAGLPTGSNAGISFRADDDSIRQIPFYIKVNDTNTGGVFEFNGKDMWYSMRFATGSSGSAAKLDLFDYNVFVKDGDFINGRQWSISNNGGNTATNSSTITIDGDTRTLRDHHVLNIDGVLYKFEDAAVGNQNAAIVSVDAVVELRAYDNIGPLIYNTLGETNDAAYGLVLLSNKSTFDGGVGSISNTPVTVGLYGSDSSRRVYYAVQYTTNDLWLLLDADDLGTGQSDEIQMGKGIKFRGTSVPLFDYKLGDYTERENNITHSYYVPKDADFNSTILYASTDHYFIAEFEIDDAISNGKIDVYIDTIDGGILGPYPAPNLSGYASSVKYTGTPSWNLKSGTQSTFLQAGYTDAGTKVWLTNPTGDNGLKISSPRQREKVEIIVYDKAFSEFGVGKIFSVNMTSRTGPQHAEVFTQLDGTNDVNALSDAQLPSLLNYLKLFPSGIINIRELVGVGVDVKFDQDSDTKDLVAKIDSGDFAYKVTLGNPATGVPKSDLIGTCLPIFGELYEVLDMVLTGSKSITFDLSQTCAPSFCGNNIIEGTETCDGTDLGGQSCQTQGFDGGTLSCSIFCTRYDTSACT